MSFVRNIPGYLFVVENILWADTYAKRIDTMKEQGNIEQEKQYISEVTYKWAERLMKKWDWSINASGVENLPTGQGVVFVSNHQSYADILPFMYNVPYQCGFIAKSEFKKVPHFSHWVERIRGIYIDRGDARSSLKTISEGAEYVKQGFSMCIFPEGTRSQSSEMGTFHPGSLKLATKAKAPIVPVTIVNAYKMYEETGIIQKHASFDVVFHDPIYTDTMSRQELAELPKMVEDIVRSAL